MTTPGKADAVWSELVREAGAPEIERAANVSVADAEEELAKAGFDVGAERAAAEERIRAVVESLPPEPAARPAAAAASHGRRRWELWVAVAAFAALAASAVVAALQ